MRLKAVGIGAVESRRGQADRCCRVDERWVRGEGGGDGSGGVVGKRQVWD